MEAIEKDDRPAAENIMSRHISSVRQSLLEHLAKEAGKPAVEKAAARKLSLPSHAVSEARPEV